MGNRLSPRQSSSKRRAAASAVARDTLGTSVSSAASTASDHLEAARQKVASAASSSAPSGPRGVVAPASTASASALANAPGVAHTMAAGSMPSAAASGSGPATTTARTATAASTGAADTDSSEQRVRRAERVLREIADEYAAKRAAGLVPTKPVPARTLLWEELAQQQQPRTGRRGQCIFGRDAGPGAVCGCSTYRKMDLPTNTGGVCECCGHGGPWHRLTGGSMWSGTGTGSSSLRFPSRSHGAYLSLLSSSRGVGRRSRAGSSARSRPLGELLTSSARSRVAVNERGEVTAEYFDGEYDDDEYDSEYDSEFDDEDEDDEDDEDIANEVARPYESGPFAGAPPLMRPPGLDALRGFGASVSAAPRRVRAESGSSTTSSNYVDRSSLVSNGSNLGLPPRLSSTSRHLDRLLGAIAKYRAMGLGEDEIEARIREDFPPTERMSSAALSPR
jgi:hypothetical protein